MPHDAESRLFRTVRDLGRLRYRCEVQCLALYLGAAWICYEAFALTAETFNLPAVFVRALVVVLIIGALLAIPVARWYQLTAKTLEEAERGTDEDVPGVPDILEPALARAYRGVRRKTAWLALGGSAIAFPLLFVLLWGAWAEAQTKDVRDPRVSVLVFPFQTAGTNAEDLGEALGDLLVVTLDGTAGVRLVDPSSVWKRLRGREGEPARPPEPGEALELGQRSAAMHYVTGRLVASGANLDVSARVYDTTTGERTAALTATAPRDSLTNLVDRLAIDLVASVWQKEQLPNVPEIERYSTDDAEALKAYLEAKSLQRRADYAGAEAAAERAVNLDSTFALAHMELFRIRSWNLYQNAQPFIGLRPIIEAALRHRDRLTPRNRLRIEANRALDDTDGVRAAFLFQRILASDSLDVDALNGIANTYLTYGWQLGKGIDEIAAAFDRVLAADPTSIVARAVRAAIALRDDDPRSAIQQLERLRVVDTTSAMARGALGTYEVLTATSAERDSILATLAAEPVPVVTGVYRNLRSARPAVAELYLSELAADSLPVSHQRIAQGARLQLWFGEGKLSGVDSAMATGRYEALRPVLNRFFVAAGLAGVADTIRARRAAEELEAYVPLDSLKAVFDSKPEVWAVGWAVAAWESTFEDTVAARAWQRALEGLPGGGTPLDYRGSLSADIEARIAARRGDLETAERQARNAYRLWGIHSNNFLESHPELAIRFHLAQLLQEGGATEEAESLYRSFNSPHSWTGFYTARSSFELGQILEARREPEAASRYFLIAARLWELGDPEIVGDWLSQTRQRLEALRGEVMSVRSQS